MKISRDNNRWSLELGDAEMFVLTQSFHAMALWYDADLEDLPEKLQTYFRGRVSAEKRLIPDLEEAQEDLEFERENWRGERLQLLKKWLIILQAIPVNEPRVLDLSREELEYFIMIINDRRLALAAEHQVVDLECPIDLNDIVDKDKRHALIEIDLLGHLLGMILDDLEREEFPHDSSSCE